VLIGKLTITRTKNSKLIPLLNKELLMEEGIVGGMGHHYSQELKWVSKKIRRA
jgi:hypothetical protein